MNAPLRLLAALALFAAPAISHAQEPGPSDASAQSTPSPQASPSPTPAPQPSPTPAPPATLENTIAAGESSDEPPQRQLVHWNEYHGPYFTIRVGAGLLVDTAAYAQDTESKEQFKLSPDVKLRDARLILRGTFPKWKRVTWSSGLMYDAPTHEFLVRETGLMIKIPELWGNLFIGRTKEGFSLNKVMVGYAGWTMERSPISDASIPILADGIKWLGYSPNYGFAWNLGVYADWLSEGQTFSTYARQAVARPIWLPIHSEKTGTVFHLGANLRYGKPKDGKLQFRSRPEAFPAPYFVDTGKFNASLSRMAGYEAYFRKGPWLLGSEYWWVDVTSPSTGNPVFHGGFVVATWIVTGETRAYNTIGGFFKAVSPKRPVFDGGPGAWEVVFNYSTIDLDSGTLKGGKFWRFTPMVNWHMSDNVRLEFGYGYGYLDRFNLKGYTNFFQTRVQLQL
jgi:phosphate-selective porin OprO/OprP